MPMHPSSSQPIHHHAHATRNAAAAYTKKSTKYFSFTEQKKGRVEGGSARGAVLAVLHRDQPHTPRSP
jgi:hypothetical protein